MNQSTTEAVRSLWANQQTINGPVLSIPLVYEYIDNKDKIRQYKEYWHVLPQSLTVKGHVDPQSLRRGIYEVVVYESKLDIRGNFQLEQTPQDKNLLEVQWDKAILTLGISDLRGVMDELQMTLNEKAHACEPGSQIPDLIASGVTLPYPVRESDNLEFQIELALQGSQNLSFTPIGNTTKIQLQSPWKTPSFNGSFLPDYRELTENGFTANWKVLQLNRNFPKSWIGNEHNQRLLDTTLGVDMILPLDDYQKSMRSAKYAAMTISLTFLIFFLVEIIRKKRIHPFQYALVGLALCLFYVLLISISEHASFNLAYGISTLTISLMVSLYALSIFKQRKTAFLLSLVMATVYGFVFIILQLTDFALLLGSVGLTAILAATMYYTRNINWYTANENPIETT